MLLASGHFCEDVGTQKHNKCYHGIWPSITRNYSQKFQQQISIFNFSTFKITFSMLKNENTFFKFKTNVSWPCQVTVGSEKQVFWFNSLVFNIKTENPESWNHKTDSFEFFLCWLISKFCFCFFRMHRRNVFWRISGKNNQFQLYIIRSIQHKRWYMFEFSKSLMIYSKII